MLSLLTCCPKLIIQSGSSKLFRERRVREFPQRNTSVCKLQVDQMSNSSLHVSLEQIKQTQWVFIPSAQWVESDSKRLRYEDIRRGHITTQEIQIYVGNHVTSC